MVTLSEVKNAVKNTNYLFVKVNYIMLFLKKHQNYNTCKKYFDLVNLVNSLSKTINFLIPHAQAFLVA